VEVIIIKFGHDSTTVLVICGCPRMSKLVVGW